MRECSVWDTAASTPSKPMCSHRRQRKLGLPHTWTQKRSRGQAISQAESMIAWHTAFSLNMGSCTATRGYAELNCTGSGSERAANECSGRLPVSHVFVRIFRYVSTCARGNISRPIQHPE